MIGGLDVHSSLVAGLFCLILAGMIKNAIDVSKIGANVKAIWKRVDKIDTALDRTGNKGAV